MEKEFMSTVSSCSFINSTENLCSCCFKKEGSIKLDCGHGYCPEDMQKLLTQMPFKCIICNAQAIGIECKTNNPTCDKCKITQGK